MSETPSEVAPHILDPDLLQQGVPHPLLAELRRREPVSLQELPDGSRYWAVLTHADVVRVSRDPATFSARRGGINLLDGVHTLPTLLSLDPPEHGEMRRRVLYAFTPRRVRALEGRMREVVEASLAAALEKEACDFVADLAAPLPLEIVGDILGIPPADRPRVAEWADALAGADDPEVRERLGGMDPNESALAFGTYAFELARDAASRGELAGEDLLSVLLNAELEGTQVDLPTFAGLFVQIAIAGNETTRSLIAAGTLELADRPELFGRLAGSPRLLPAAIEELLRWITPVHYFRRTATRDVELSGVRIAEGEKVVLVYASANRDEAVFPEPDRFDPTRDPNPHLAFGFGEHFCLGAALARLEARVFFEVLLRRVAGIELLGEPAWLRSSELHSLKRMPVRLVPR